MTCATYVNISNSISLVAPESRVRRFEFSKFETVWGGTPMICHSLIPSPGRFPNQLHDTIHGIFSVRFAGRKRSVYILQSIPQNNFNILMADNARCCLISTLIESRAETLSHSCHRILSLRKVKIFLIGNRLTGISVNGFNLFTLEFFFKGEIRRFYRARPLLFPYLKPPLFKSLSNIHNIVYCILIMHYCLLRFDIV
jgi:hypothetical protein